MRVFLSYPMHGRTREECLKFREELTRHIKDSDEWVDNLDCEGHNFEETPRLWYLGEAIKLLGTCDAIMVHPHGWSSKGCTVELEVAELYGIPVIDIGDPDFIEFCEGNVRTANALRRGGYGSRIALKRATKEELLNIRGVGKITFEHIMKLKESVD